MCFHVFTICSQSHLTTVGRSDNCWEVHGRKASKDETDSVSFMFYEKQSEISL